MIWPSWDGSLFHAINGIDLPSLTWFMQKITNVDNWIPFILAAVVVLLWAGRTVPRITSGGRWRKAFCSRNPRIVLLCLILSTAAADQISYHIKNSVGRPRPCFDDSVSSLVDCRWEVHGNRSFPSSHAANSAALATTTALAYPPLAPYAALLSILVGFSRVYLGVHYPIDVITGWGLGFSSALLFWLLMKRMASRPGLIGFSNRFRYRQPVSGITPGPPWKPIELTSLDGYSMTGYLIEGGARLVIVVHGLSEGIEYMARPGEVFAGMGYSVLLVPLRGHDSHPVPVTSGGPAEVYDLAGVLSFARDNLGFARSDTVIYGTSMGGSSAVKTAGMLGDEIGGVIAHGSYDDFFASAERRLGTLRTKLLKLFLPGGVVRALEIFRPSDYPGRWQKTGIVYITGDHDRIAPPEVIRNRETTTGSSLLVLKGAGHPSWRRVVRNGAQIRTAFEKALKLIWNGSAEQLSIDSEGRMEDYRPSYPVSKGSEK